MIQSHLPENTGDRGGSSARGLACFVLYLLHNGSPRVKNHPANFFLKNTEDWAPLPGSPM